MTILIIKLVFICSVLVLAATVVTQEGMLLYSVRQWAEKQNKKIFETIILCPFCMPSTWSFVAIGFAYGLGIIEVFTYKIVFIYFLTVGGSCIVSGWTWTLYRLMSEVTHFYNLTNEKLEADGES